MKGGRWAWGVLIAGACSGAAMAAPGCPSPLRVGFSDSATPPGLMGRGARFEEPPGWEVAAVREALSRLGCRADLQRLPTRRLRASLEQGSLDFALLYGATPERMKALRFPLDAQGGADLAWAPVFGHLALFGRAGTPQDAGWDGRHLAASRRVGAATGSVQEGLAHERGWTVEPVPSLEAGLPMLQVGRFDLLLATRESLTPEQRAGLVEWAPPVARLPYFMPAAPAFEQRHPAWTRSFWHEFCRAVRRLEPDVRATDCGVVPPAVVR